jgi:ketosteroid isomerase-like protein
MDTIEPLRDALEGFNRRDMAPLKAVLAPEVNWFAEPPSDAFCPDRDHVVAQLGRLAVQGEKFQLDEVEEAGDRIAVESRDADGGLWWLVFTLRDGKVVRMDDRSSRESARQAIGHG